MHTRCTVYLFSIYESGLTVKSEGRKICQSQPPTLFMHNLFESAPKRTQMLTVYVEFENNC